MIPRLKPFFNKKEIFAALRPQKDAIALFEQAFAKKFEAKHALAFSYGRSALWAFFKAFKVENAEIIMPAYTCVVVAHATVLSGNIPRFVDINLTDYNMNLDQVEEAINENTRAIIATHLFGYPLNVVHLKEIVYAAEKRFGHKIWIIQDCAHSFGARFQGELVCNEGELALFGLNISKTISSVFGGMIITNNTDIYNKLKGFREKKFLLPGFKKKLRRLLYLFAVYPAFTNLAYSFVYFLQEKTSILKQLTDAYHLDDEIHFPPDYLDQMTALEARVGLAQLDKYKEIIARRQENAIFYDEQLQDLPGFNLPPLVDGATYSHYVIRVPDRERILKAMSNKGVQLGQLIEYSVPHMEAYIHYADKKAYSNSHLCSYHTVNLPLFSGLSKDSLKHIISAMKQTSAEFSNS